MLGLASSNLLHVAQAVQLPSKESKKQVLADAAAQLMKNAVTNQAPSSKATPLGTLVPLSTLTSKAGNPNRLPAHDEKGNLLPGLITQNRLDQVLSSVRTHYGICILYLVRY